MPDAYLHPTTGPILIYTSLPTAGCISLVIFFLVTLYFIRLMTEVYEVNGQKHRSYSDAVYSILGRTHSIVLACFQQANLVLTTIGYMVTAGMSMS